MKKLSFYLLSISILASCLLFTSCEGDDEDPAVNIANDKTAPTVVSVSPTDGAIGISVDATITIQFSETIDINSVSNTSVILSGGASNSIATIVSITGSTMTIDPNNDLEIGTEYLLRFSTALKDLAGNGLASNFSTQFTTEENFKVTSINPEDGATDIPVGITIEVNFTKPVDINSVTNTSLILSGGFSNSIATIVTVSLSTGLMTIDPNNDLEEGTEYLLRISGLKDKDGEVLVEDFSATFTTVSTVPEVSTPTVSEVTSTTARLNSTTIDAGSGQYSEKGFVYNTTGNPTLSDTKISLNSGAAFETIIQGLNSNTTYYIKAFGTSSAGTGYSSEINFTTLNVPTVITQDPISVINRSAVVAGSITPNGNSISNYGIVWAVSSGVDISNQTIESTAGSTNFNVEILNRNPDQTIYYRAFATISGTSEIVYGAEKSFTTTNIGGGEFSRVEYSGLNSIDIIGEFYYLNIGTYPEWAKSHTGQTTVIYEQKNFDAWSIYLDNKNGQDQYQIDVYRGIISYTINGNEVDVYKIRKIYK